MKEDFEGKLRDIVENTEQSVDVGEMWLAIEDKMARKKQRRGILWIFFSVGSLALVLMLFSMYENIFTVENHDAVAHTTLMASKGEKNTDCITSSIPLSTSTRTKIESREERPSVDREVDESTLQSSAQFNPYQNQDNSGNIQLTYREVEDTNKDESTIVNQHIKVRLDLLKAKDQDEEQIKDPQPIVAQFNDAERAVETSTLSLWQFQRVNADITRQATGIHVKHEPVNSSYAVFGETEDSVVIMDYMTGITFALLANRGSKMVLNEEQSPYLAARNATESFLDMYSINAKLELLKWKGLSIRAGLGYNYLTDVFEWEGDIVKEMDKSYLAARIYEVNQGVVDEYEIGLTKVRFEKYVKQYNEQHFINLPVGIAYEYLFYKFSLGIHADLNVAYRLGNDVKFLQDNLLIETRSLSSEWISPYLSYGLHLSYALQNGYEIGFTAERKRFEITSLKNRYEMYGYGVSFKKNW